MILLSCEAGSSRRESLIVSFHSGRFGIKISSQQHGEEETGVDNPIVPNGSSQRKLTTTVTRGLWKEEEGWTVRLQAVATKE